MNNLTRRYWKVVVPVFILLWTAAQPLSACLREFAPEKEFRPSPDQIYPYVWKYDGEELQLRIEQLRNKSQDSTGYKIHNDIGVALIRMGKFDEAVTLLAPLAEQHPESGELLGNLAMAYEFSGRTDKAIELLRKAASASQRINDQETLHLRMLEAAEKIKTDANWLTANPIAGMDPLKHKATVRSSQPWFRIQLLIQDLDKLVRDHLPFVKQPDAVMAHLLWTLGCLHKQESSLQAAFIYFSLAQKMAGGANETIQASLTQLGLSQAEQPDLSAWLPADSAANKQLPGMDTATKPKEQPANSGSQKLLILGGLGIILLAMAVFYLSGWRKNK